MLISHRKQFIYLKTVKTASTSVELYFEQYCMNEGEWSFSHSRDVYVSNSGIIGFRGKRSNKRKYNPKWYHHMAAFKVRDLIGESIWNNYFKFCIIRNPYEKILSAFFHFYIKENQIAAEKAELISLFREWILSGKGDYIDRDKYLINNEICVDYFIRYENLIEDLERVCFNINVPYDPSALPFLKSSIKPRSSNIHEYYDKKSAFRIETLFQFEFEYFKYRKLNR